MATKTKPEIPVLSDSELEAFILEHVKDFQPTSCRISLWKQETDIALVGPNPAPKLLNDSYGSHSNGRISCYVRYKEFELRLKLAPDPKVARKELSQICPLAVPLFEQEAIQSIRGKVRQDQARARRLLADGQRLAVKLASNLASNLETT